MPELFPGAKLIGRASVTGSLYDLGSYPGLRLDESSSPVAGELYEVDDEILYKLDEIEAPSHYWRKQVEVSLDDYRKLSWVYVYDPQFYSGTILIKSGDWIEYAKTKTGSI